MVKKIKNSNITAIMAIRMLAATMISNAKSGHTGIALGAAPIMYELFANNLNISPNYRDFFNRDRFVLSAGHASALLYATMYVCGYTNLTMNDLNSFRQLDSITPGHPERTILPGVDVSTGPLGQGIAMAVGLAIAEKKLAQHFNSQIPLIDHYTYCLFSDGDLQEGVAYEAISLAGHLKLNKLIMLYDSNDIQLDGKVSSSTSFNVKKFFKSMGWNYIKVSNCEASQRINYAIKFAKLSSKPTVIECKTTIGFGSKYAGTSAIHGKPLTSGELKELQQTINYDINSIDNDMNILQLRKRILTRVDKVINTFNSHIHKLEVIKIDLHEEIIKLINHQSKKIDIEKIIGQINGREIEASRDTAHNILQLFANDCSNLIVSCADLTSSTKVKIDNEDNICRTNFINRNLPCGVREFAMVAINNGIIAHGGCRAIGSTFLAFSDYTKAAIRLAAINQLPNINIFSHDSLTVGEDGPTHQPIEQLWSLRLIPNHKLFRPCNKIDMVIALGYGLINDKIPVSIATSRNAFKQIEVPCEIAKNGGYIIFDNKKIESPVKLFLYATGSEVPIAIEIAESIDADVKVVAINSLELLFEQSKEYLKQIFPRDVKRVSIEFGSTLPWYRFVDLAIGINRYGCSAKTSDVLEKFNLTTEKIKKKILDFINKGEKK